MSEKYDVIERARQAGYLRVFLQAVESAELTKTLKGAGPYTIFAPIDDAFMRVPKPKLEALFKIENRESLLSLLRYHIILGNLPTRELKRLDEIKNAKGDVLRIDSRLGLWVNEGQVLTADLVASNGVLHAIDAVLTPQTQVAGAS
jgi:uncharacterized surface protein with fasciclin (FAS1) repeats